MAAYHYQCYVDQTGNKDAKIAYAKYPFTCGVCGKPGERGCAFTWTRREKPPGGAREEKEGPGGSKEEAAAGGSKEEAAARQDDGNASEAVAVNIGIDVEKFAKALTPHLDGKLTPKKHQHEDGGGPGGVNVIRVALAPSDLGPMPEVDAGAQHFMFPILLKACSRKRVNIWLAGPSGSGKTTAAEMVAKVLGAQYRFTGALSDVYGLLGYKNAQGEYVRTNFREAYEHGGLFLLDEVDASDPTVPVGLNAALSGSCCAFPDGMVPRHPDCIIIAAANTWGHGGTHEYVGRMKQDQAFLKRFASIPWDYDENLEMATAPNPGWTKRVQTVRKRVRDKGMRVLVTPRESYIGAELLAAGIDQPMVERMTIRSGMTDEQWNQVSQ